MTILTSILQKKLSIKKAQQKFLCTLFQTILTIPGRINFLSLSRYSTMSERTFRRWFSSGMDMIRLNIELLGGSLKHIGRRDWIIAIDSVVMEKSGKSTFGLGKLWSSTKKSIINGVEFHCIALVDTILHTAFHLSSEQITTGGESSRIEAYLNQLRSVKDQLHTHSRYVVADGFYAKKMFIDGVTEMGFILISKLRQDADLRHLYQGKQKIGRGRKKKYDGKVKVQKSKGFKYLGKQQDYKMYQGVFYSVRFKRNIKVIKLQNHHSGAVALLFSTDLKLQWHKIEQYYHLRFQIEFLFRDARQYTGLDSCQSVKQKSLHTHVNASLTALNIAKLDLLADNNFDPALPISIHDYKQRQQNAHIADFIFSNLEIDRNSKKIKALTKELLNIGCINYSKAA